MECAHAQLNVSTYCGVRLCTQVANEFCARRINDEFNFFQGILQSPIFLAVIAITMALQAAIIHGLGMFFKVRSRVVSR